MNNSEARNKILGEAIKYFADNSKDVLPLIWAWLLSESFLNSDKIEYDDINIKFLLSSPVIWC